MHSVYSPERAGTGTFKAVQGRTHTCTGCTPPKRAGSGTCTFIHGRTHTCTSVNTETGRDELVHVRPGPYTQVQRSYTPERAGTGTFTLVQGCIHRNGRVRAPTNSFKGVHTETGWFGNIHARPGAYTRAQGLHTEMGRYGHVHARPWAYTHVHSAYSPERAGTGTCTLRRRHKCTPCTQPKRAGWGTCTHVQGCTHTCTWRKHRNGSVRARSRRSKDVHTEAGWFEHVHAHPGA